MSRIYASQSYWYTVSVTHSPLSITQSYRKSTPSQCQDAQWQDPQHCQARHLHTRHQTKQVLHLQTVHWFHYNTRSNPNSHSPEPDTFLTFVIQTTFNTHHIELQPRPRDCNESIIINQVLVLTLARTRHILDIVIQATFNTHNIELQPRPRDCNESIIINQVLVLTLARTRHIPDIVIQATTVTRHIEHSAQARPISQSTMNQSTSTRTHHPEALLKSRVFLRDQNWTSTRTHHPEVLLKSLAFIRDKYLDISQDNLPEVFYSSHEFSSETRN